MKKYLSIFVFSILVGASVCSNLQAQSGAVSLQGSLNGADYTIQLPANWNGTLLVWAHGYRDVADAPGEVEDHAAHLDPPSLEPYFLSLGYGFAASAFRVNGYNIQEGMEDTKALMGFFRETVGKPQRTIVFGRSGGGAMAAGILENGDGLFDGAISYCGVMAGTPLFFDRGLAFDVAYATAFGWPSAWGTPGDLRDDLDFEIDVLPVFIPQLTPQNFGRLEFIRLVSGIPMNGFYDGPNALFLNMFFTTEGRAQLERKFGGPGAQNLDHTYRLSAAEKASLANLGVNADALLNQMNAQTIYSAKQSVRSYMEKFISFNGNIKKPLLLMNAIDDGLATPDNESVYASINQAAGKQDLLLQVYTDGVGHCTFTADQVLSTIQGMDFWLNTGTKPDLSFFPTSLGFDHNFQPGPWPQPVR